eukprot:4631860-Pleurochrysis_carterae.AAC.2
MVGARTVAVRCARHMRCPWRGSGMHGCGEGGRAAAVHSQRAGECGLLRPRDVISKRRIRHIISLARTARRGRGGEVFNMRIGNSHGCVSTAMVV